MVVNAQDIYTQPTITTPPSLFYGRAPAPTLAPVQSCVSSCQSQASQSASCTGSGDFVCTCESSVYASVLVLCAENCNLQAIQSVATVQVSVCLAFASQLTATDIFDGFTTVPTTARLTTSQRSSATSSPSYAPTAASASSHSSNQAAVTGGAVGGVVLVVLVLAFLFFWLRRKRSGPRMSPAPLETEFAPPVSPGAMASQTRPTYPSMPTAPSFDQGYTVADTFDNASRYTYPSPSAQGYGSEPIATSSSMALLSPQMGHAVPVVGHMTHDGNFPDAASVPASSSTTYPPDIKVRPPESPQSERARLLSDSSSSQPGSSTSGKMHVANDSTYATLPNAGYSKMPTPDGKQLQPSPDDGSQQDPLDLATVLDVISRARLSPREMQVVSNLSTRLAPEPSAPAAPAAPATSIAAPATATGPTMDPTMEGEPTSEQPPPPYAM